MSERAIVEILGASNNETELQKLLRLSETEHDALTSTIDAVIEYDSIDGIFKIAQANWSEFFEGLRAGAQRLQRQESDMWFSKFRDDVDRRLLNFLASMRMFLDYAAGRLRAKLGEVAHNRFQAATNRVYDASFSYRFCSNLRNFVQHRGTAQIKTILSSRLGGTADIDAIVQENSTSRVSSVRVEVQPQDFISDKKMKASFLRELEGRGPTEDVVLHIQNVLEPLQELNDQFLTTMAAALAHQAETLIGFARRFVGLQAGGKLALVSMPSNLIENRGRFPRTATMGYTPLPLSLAVEILKQAGR